MATKEEIERELEEVDKQKNPHTDEEHGEPETPREQERRKKFAELWGDQD
jgi:hypothetical protein